MLTDQTGRLTLAKEKEEIIIPGLMGCMRTERRGRSRPWCTLISLHVNQNRRRTMLGGGQRWGEGVQSNGHQQGHTGKGG